MPQKRTTSPGMASHTVRTRDGGTKALRYGRKAAIRLHCTECLGWEDSPEVCTDTLCALYPFRGKTLASWKKDRAK